MSAKQIEHSATSIIESIDTLFFRFLVGKHKIYKVEEYNDGLSEDKSADKQLIPDSLKNGEGQSSALENKKNNEQCDSVDKRNVLLMRYFQQTLAKVIDVHIGNSDSLITKQLHESTLELLQALLRGEPRYSKLALLLETNTATKNYLLSLIANENFMSGLGRSPRKVRDTHSAIGLVGTEVLRYLLPALVFKCRIDFDSRHHMLFAQKLWRYGLTLGQACSALMNIDNYRRPYEGMLLSMMVNFTYVASYQQYLSSFDVVRHGCLSQAKKKGDKYSYDFFHAIETAPGSLQKLLLQSNLQLSLSISEKLFSKSFPHLVSALKEEVDARPFEARSKLGKILFQALRFSKYEQLRTSRLVKSEWLEKYLKNAHITPSTYKILLSQKLDRFKPTW